MTSLWNRLVLGATLLLVVVVAGNEDKVVGARCYPGRTGAWGYWREVKSECVGPEKFRSDRCKKGETTPAPRLVCVRQDGPEPPREETTLPTTTKKLAWNFKRPSTVATAIGRTRVTRPTRVTGPTGATRPTTVTRPIRVTRPTRVTRPSWVTIPMKVIKTTTTNRPTTNKPTTTTAIPVLFSAAQALAVAKKKCVEYREHVRTRVMAQTFLIAQEEVIEDSCHRVGQQLIAGGVLAYSGEFPHMAALGYHPPGSADDLIVWRCGGSLISPLFVLTAAHCIYDRYTGKVQWVLLGAIYLADKKAQRIDVIGTFKHPAYSVKSNYDDIALLKLKHAPMLSPGLRPACVGIQSHAEDVVAPDKFGTAYDVTGWGLNTTGGDGTENLMKVDLYQVPVKTCDDAFHFLTVGKKLAEGIRRDSMLCIGNKVPGKDSCQGDSGGPAQTFLNGTDDTYCMYDVAGITSFGESTCGGDVYKASIYTKVRHYLPWIATVVWPEEANLSSK